MGNKLNKVLDAVLNNEDLLARVMKGELESVVAEVQADLRVHLSELQLKLLFQRLLEIQGK